MNYGIQPRAGRYNGHETQHEKSNPGVSGATINAFRGSYSISTSFPYGGGTRHEENLMSSIDTSNRQDAHAFTAEDDIPRVPVGKGWFVYGFCTLYILFLLDFAARLGITTVFPDMQRELGFSDSQIGVAGSVVLLGMTAFVLPFSFLADKTSKRRVISLMSALWGVGCLLCGVISNFFMIVFGRFLVGVGNSSFAPVAVSILTSWSRRSRWGSVLGLFNSAMSVGLALGTAVAGLLAQKYGWRVPFVLIGGLTLLFAALSLLLPRSEREVPVIVKEAVSFREALAFTAKNKTLILLGVGAGASNMVYASMIAWIPMFLVRYMGWTSGEVGAYMGPVYLLSGLLVMPLSGVLSDKLGLWDRRTRAWLCFPCYFIVSVLFTIAAVYQVFFCFALGMVLYIIPITGVHIATQELVPVRYRASSYGTYVIFLQGLGFFGPMLAGALSDAFGLQLSLIYMQATFVLGALIMLIAGFTYNADFTRAQALEA